MSYYTQEGTAAHMLAEACLREGRLASSFLGQQFTPQEEPHSALGASGASRWFVCPGSIREAAKVPKSVEAPIAFTVDQDMAEAVQVYLSTIWALVGPSVSMTVEHRFDLSWLVPGMFGTADCVLIDWAARKAYVVDYKHGKGVVVYAKENPQLKYYALGALHGVEGIDTVELVIVQPRCPEGEPVDRWSLPVSELRAWGVEVLLPAAKATQSETAPLRAGDHCKWCKARRDCAGLRAHVNEIACTQVTQGPIRPISEWTTGQKLKLVESLDLLTALAKEAKATLQAEAEAGTFKHDDWKLVKAKSNRKWLESAAATLAEVLSADEMYAEPKLKGLRDMEKALRAKGVDVDAWMAAATEKPDKGLTLVHKSDSRKEVPPPIENMFVECKSVWD